MSIGQWVKILLGFIFILCLVGSESAPPMEQLMLSVFRQLQIRPHVYVLHHGGRTEKSFQYKEIAPLAKYFTHVLRLPSPQERRGQRHISYSSSGVCQQKWDCSIQVINFEPHHTWVQPFISIRIKGEGLPEKRFFHLRQLVQQALVDVNVQPRFDFSIQGKTANKDGARLLQKALSTLHASPVEAIRQQPFISISAFTPLVTERLRTLGGWMNVQTAARIERTTGMLVFTLGSPIITMEY